MKTQETINKACVEDEQSKKNDSIRKPKQTRSMETKGKILKTSLKLFCENGFYKTTTNEIAKQASVPIGSLYSYFKNKDMILFEILDDYHQTFIDKINGLNLVESKDLSESDKRSWIRSIIEALIEIHEESKEFNKELKALYHSMPKVAEIHEMHDLKMRERIIKELEYFKDELKITDLEASAVIISDTISSVVDCIVFSKSPLSNERIANEGVTIIYKYLFA